jgi:hypothetical protein
MPPGELSVEGRMVFETVRRARRRMLANEVVQQAAYSFSAALGSLILLLLLGTQILSWPWLVLLPAGALAAGIYAIRRRTPSPYRVAQQVDRRLDLSDTLSTALFFAGATDRPGPADIRRAQRSQAERLAAGLDLRRAIPMRVPRAVYGTALLGLIASSLFALRYGLSHRLDLRPPLARIVQEKLSGGERPESARVRKPPALREPDRPEDAAFSLDEAQQKGPGELDGAPEQALDTVDEPNVDNSKSGANRADAAKAARSQQAETGQSEGEESEGMSLDTGNQESADGRQGPGAGKQGQGGEKQASGSPGENSSLLNKFRDALSSLLSRMRQQTGAAGARQEASAQGSRQSQSQAGNSREDGKQGRQGGDGQPSDVQDGQSGDPSQNSQSAQSRSAGQGGQEPSTKQPGSGIGRQDGSKDVKLAEQLAAMGKISEIIGKRSANVTGDVTVESQSGNQQLRTPYAERAAHHTEAGGEISRDEVPVALQTYVQQYFEEVRKLAPGTGSAAPRPDTRVRRRTDSGKTPGF